MLSCLYSVQILYFVRMHVVAKLIITMELLTAVYSLLLISFSLGTHLPTVTRGTLFQLGEKAVVI